MGEGVDRLNQRHVLELADFDDKVRMRDLLFPLEEANRPRDVTFLANGQELFHPTALGAEVDKLDVPGLVMGKNPVWQVRFATRGRLVPVDVQFQRCDIVVHRPRHAIHTPTIDDPRRHVHQQIKRDRFLALGRAKKAGQQGR